MQMIELPIDVQLMQQARGVAAMRHASLESLLVELIERLVRQYDPIIGMFADEPDLIDTIMADILKSRDMAQLRVGHG